MRLATVIQSHHLEGHRARVNAPYPIGLGLINALFPAKVKAFVHVLALELPQLSM